MLNIEVIKFEAQDVITASCICGKANFCGGPEGGDHYAYFEKADGQIDHTICPADTHTDCKNPPAMS